MTVAHANLTGTDLHEIKGASTATAGQVPVANGSGSAPFSLIGPSSLSQTANAFGANLVHVQETKNDGISSGFTGLTSFTVMPLGTTVTNEISGASIGSNYVSLPAGTYYFEGYFTHAANSSSSKSKARLWNNTSGTVIMNGPTATGAMQCQVPFAGRFTLGTSATIVIQSLCTGGNIYPVGAGTGNEVYTDLKFWKLA